MNRLFNLAVDPSDLGMSLLRAGTQEELQDVIGAKPAQTQEKLWVQPKLADFDVKREDGWTFSDYDKGILIQGTPATQNVNSLRKVGITLPANTKRFSVRARMLRYNGAASWMNHGLYCKRADGKLRLLSQGKDAYDFQVYLQNYTNETTFDSIGAASEWMKYGDSHIWMRWDYERETNFLRGFISPDGYFWQPFTTAAADESYVGQMVEVGYYVNPNLGGTNAVTYRLETAGSLQSFELETQQ